MPATLRPAAVAGSWYPGSADAIAREVDGYLEEAAVAPLPRPARRPRLPARRPALLRGPSPRSGTRCCAGDAR